PPYSLTALHDGDLTLPLHRVRIQKTENGCGIRLDHLQIVMPESPAASGIREIGGGLERMDIVSGTGVSIPEMRDRCKGGVEALFAQYLNRRRLCRHRR